MESNSLLDDEKILKIHNSSIKSEIKLVVLAQSFTHIVISKVVCFLNIYF